MKMPNNIRQFLWDTDPDIISIHRHKNFLVTRIAEKGGWKEITWLLQQFPLKEIKRIVGASKNTSPKVKNFWKIL